VGRNCTEATLTCRLVLSPRAGSRSSSHAMSSPRYLPLTFLQRAKPLALTRSPSRIAPAYPPIISAFRIGRSFTSSASTRFVARPRLHDQYTPDRIPNAAWPYIYKKFDRMPSLDTYFQQVDSLQDHFIERLREAVAIPSISSEDSRRPDVVKVCIIRSAHGQELLLIMKSDGPLACGPDQGAWWYR
jgi:hypothetical protein